MNHQPRTRQAIALFLATAIARSITGCATFTVQCGTGDDPAGVFTSPLDPRKPLGPWVLEEQMSQLRTKLNNVRAHAGLHALRHTFLTEAGEQTDPVTLQYVAGRDNIKTTMRYVHPQEQAVQKLFVRLGHLERPEQAKSSEGWVQNRVQPGEGADWVQNRVQWLESSERIVSKLLETHNLLNAEVVELADTPS